MTLRHFPSTPRRLFALDHIAMSGILAMLLMALTPSRSCARPATQKTIDSLLTLIDKTMSETNKYVDIRMRRIDSLKARLAKEHDTGRRYALSFSLYEEYLPFQNDSALTYIERSAELARLEGNESKAGGCESLMALSCSNAGMYADAENILDAVAIDKLHGEDLGLYYYARSHVSGEMAFYGKVKGLATTYGKNAETYRQKVTEHLPKDNRYLMQMREMEEYSKGRLERSLAINTEWLRHARKGSTEYAVATYCRYLEYNQKGDSLEAMAWLAEAVLTDIRNAVMDQGAMWEMANILMREGDVNRSYRYICYTSDCAERFGSRQRLTRISPLLTRIAQTYKSNMEESNKSLESTLTLISVMALLLLLSLAYLLRQRNHLARTRDELAMSNANLQDSNRQLSEMNARQASLNAQLADLNRQLAEANVVKEEYVGRFMRLCSMYIDKLDSLRKKVGKKVKARQYGELLELTRSTDFKEEEINELYANFDSAFLHLFPSFVDDFNALLRPESRVNLTEKGRLNTIVRIFALIRLGITDSSKIAEFLHYSVNTIYNYRAHTKNCALVDRAQFENMVRKIGMPSELYDA